MRKLSVITVTYNDPEGLLRTRDSIFSSALRFPVEWVVVDSSPEKSKEIIAEASKRLEVRYLCSDPKGIYPAMNLGVDSSTGDYLWFLNGGDELYSDENLSPVFDRMAEGKDLILAPVEMMRGNRRAGVTSIPDPIHRYLLGMNRICHQGVFYKRELFFPPFPKFSENLKIVSDYLHLLEITKFNLKTGFTELPVARFYKGGTSDRVIKAMKEFLLVHRENLAGLSAGERAVHLMRWAQQAIVISMKRGARHLPGSDYLKSRWNF